LSGAARYNPSVLRILAAIFALIAVALLALAIVGMITGKFTDRQGWALRAAALGCFALTVILNVLGH
jgi:hypothetical protein